MARRRKRHVQAEIRFPNTWGGRREGAGRPRKGKGASEHHKTRPRLLPSQPVHVTTRVTRKVGSLRKRHMYQALREATIAIAEREDCRIVHFSIQSTHVHMIVEAKGRMPLARGMQAFFISAAKQINRSVFERTGKRRKGKVFVDRYHSRILKTPREVRNAIAYVINNWRRHQEDRARFATAWKCDPYSNGWQFDGWREREDAWYALQPPPTYESLLTWFPKTWLLREGWRRHGLISFHEIPGPLA